MSDSRNFIYEKVTKQILDDIIRGDLPWRRVRIQKKGEKSPYTNPFTKIDYKPFNCMLLGRPGEYATMKQINKAGGRVRKGAKGRVVVYWDVFLPEKNRKEAERLEAEGKSIEHLKAVNLKYYTVFNLDDVDGLKRKPEEEQPQMQAAENPTALANLVIDSYSASESIPILKDNHYEPAWRPSTDSVEMPNKELFALEEDWYASLFGELVHSTSAEKRCDRRKEFEEICGGEKSVREELVAEIGSSMLLCTCGIQRRETQQQISAECKKWVEAFNNDFRLIVSAAARAEKAARYVLGDLAA